VTSALNGVWRSRNWRSLASGKNFMQLGQSLTPHRIGCSVEQDLDLGVIALSRFNLSASQPPDRKSKFCR
jgi:hypothetical protein